MSTLQLPCGSWPTPITADLVLASAVTIGGAALDGGTVYWSESRPAEGGRTQLVRLDPGEAPRDVLPEGADARTAVHEYGGGAWWVRDGVVWYVDWSDQRLRRLAPGEEPVLLTEAAPEGGSVRWADGDVHPHDGRLAVVRETHPAGGGGSADVVNEIVVLAPDGSVRTAVTGPDFVSDPRWSPDGDALSWLEWNHPDMPWDAATLLVRWRGGIVTIAGGPDEGVFGPQWAPDGSLWFCSDREDWWSLFRWTPDGGVQRMLDRSGDVGVPQWTFGQRRYAVLPDGRAVVALVHDGLDSVLLLDPDGTLTELDTGCTHVTSLTARGSTVVLVGASPTTEPAVLALDLDSGPVAPTVLSGRRDLGLGAEWFSVPEHLEFPGSGGLPTYASFYPPVNPDVAAHDGELPPLVVMIHGGPTSAAVSALSLGKQYWTSRGFAVVDVDYGGSTGYGRAYRNRLRGEWGVVDVEDCVAVTRWLAEQGRVDPARCVIRGGSAGGFTTLMALAVSDVFAAGCDLFGVVDVEALALETHKFESRYLDRLVAPYPEGRAVYVERSPLSHLDSLTAPLVVLQGAEDKVVPPSQSEAIVAALRERGIPVAYRLYEGEQHGFRRAENIRDALGAELSFYAQVLGFALPPDEKIPTLEIENLPG